MACFKFAQKLVDKLARRQEGKTEKWQDGKRANSSLPHAYQLKHFSSIPLP